MTDNKIIGVPTNIITGFLGVGKTSAILHLLKHKPENERWAILVNEFGEIGVDGSLFSGDSSDAQVFVREVPGGCMCCASGLPMQIALNQLLSHAKPDRLLIEPTGLGHPVEVLELLTNNYYQEVLDLQKTVTLIDARKLNDDKYRQHETFVQQLAVADVIVANKTDLYEGNEQQLLEQFLAQRHIAENALHATSHGQLSFAWLEGNTGFNAEKAEHAKHAHKHHDHNHDHEHSHSHHHDHEHDEQTRPLASEQALPETGYLKAVNQGEGFKSVGWRFSPDKIFDRHALLTLLLSINAERLKAVFITADGIFGYNATDDGLQEYALDECLESRIEIIATEVDDNWEQQLLKTLA